MGYSGAIQPIPVDVGTVELAAPRTVGQKPQVAFQPNPDLPFTPTLYAVSWYIDGEPHYVHNVRPAAAQAARRIHAEAYANVPDDYIQDYVRLRDGTL